MHHRHGISIRPHGCCRGVGAWSSGVAVDAIIGVDMARTGARGARWSMEVVAQALKKRNLCQMERTRAEFEALKRHECWLPSKTPTDVHAPLPVLSSMSKAEAVAQNRKFP